MIRDLTIEEAVTFGQEAFALVERMEEAMATHGDIKNIPLRNILMDSSMKTTEEARDIFNEMSKQLNEFDAYDIVQETYEAVNPFIFQMLHTDKLNDVLEAAKEEGREFSREPSNEAYDNPYSTIIMLAGREANLRK